jgi:hypothetical protein
MATIHESQENTRTVPPPNAAPALDSVRDALSGLRFGTVTVFVQDGVVVQVERTEKFRVRSR